jgi:hypothetical protein
MRKWSPSKKTVGIWAGAVLLAAMSLPSPPLLPQSGERHRHSAPAQTMPRVGAIPTMASFDEDGSASGNPAAASTAGTTASTTAGTTAGTAVSTTAGTTAGTAASTAASSTAGTTATNQTTDGANDKHSPNRPKPAAPRQQQPGQWQKRDQAQQPGQAQQPRQQQPGQAQRPSQQPGHTQQQQQQQQQHPSQAQRPSQQQPGQAPAPVTPQQLPDVGTPGSNSPFTPYVPWPTGKLRLRVIDGRTMQPLEGAEVVLIETEQRVTTDRSGYTPWMEAPMIRNPRYRPMVAELHGQLGVIAYKNGYRDSIHLGIRMHEGFRSESTVWMYKLGPGDTRIEPVLYQVPYHHLWLVELADKFRSKSQLGEGPERP